MFEKLVLDGQVEIDGQDVTIKRGAEINVKIYAEDGHVVIKFGSPPLQLRVNKIGPKKLVNMLRPTLQEVQIHKDRYSVLSDNCPDIDFER
jgi:DUF1009 family protein